MARSRGSWLIRARRARWAGRWPQRPDEVPAHRVINARGDIPGGHASRRYRLHRKRLEAERVVFTQDGRVDLDRYLWLPAVSPASRAGAASGEQARDGAQDDRADNGHALHVAAIDLCHRAMGGQAGTWRWKRSTIDG